MHGSSFIDNSYFVVNFSLFMSTLEIAVLLAWELKSEETSSRFYDLLVIWGFPEKASFGLSLFFSFRSIFAAFWVASGSLLALFGILWNLFGLLVSSLWVPLARLGCLWALSGTFCDTLV